MKANLENIQKIYNELPGSYIHENVPYDNYQMLEELHFNHGWREVVLPNFNPKTEKLSDSFILVENVVTKVKIELTEEEILEKTKETIRQFLAKKKQDGRNYFNEIELIITMQLAGMLIMDLVVVSEQIESILYKPLNYIKNGDYFSAMMLFNNQDTIPPTHPIVLNHWNEMKSYCIAYFNENYPKTTIE